MPTSFADLLTPQGVVAAAALTTSLVALLRTALPALTAHVSGATLAFAITALLYLAACAAIGVATFDAAFAAFVAWLSCATSAVGIHSTIKHATTTGV